MIYIGIDIGKLFHYASLSAGGKPFVFSNSGQGFNAMLKWAKEHGNNFEFGLEPTGHYNQVLMNWLTDHGFAVRVIQGITVNRAKHLFSNTRNKTDNFDCWVIAKCTEAGYGRLVENRPEPFTLIKQLVCARRRHMDIQASTTNRIKKLIDMSFPELSKVNGRMLRYKWFRELLREAPSPQKIKLLTPGEIAKRGKQGQAQVIALAQDSVGEASWVVDMEISALADLYERNLEQLKVYDKLIIEQIQQVEYSENLMTIPYLGPICTSNILGYAGDLLKFPTNRHLMKHAGLNLIENSSGARQGHAHISREGNKYLRTALYQSAFNMARKDSPFYDWYFSRVKRGVPSRKIFMAGARKLLRIAHAIAHTNEPFKRAVVV